MDCLEMYKNGFKEILKPAMKELGFKKDVNFFIKEQEEYKFVVNIQKSQWNTKEKVSFFINVGIDIDDFYRIIGLSMKMKYQCFWSMQKRIESFLPSNSHEYTIGRTVIQQIIDNEKKIIGLTDVDYKDTFKKAVSDIIEVYKTNYENKGLVEVLKNIYMTNFSDRAYLLLIDYELKNGKINNAKENKNTIKEKIKELLKIEKSTTRIIFYQKILNQIEELFLYYQKANV